jgi:hypothetical protein
VLDAHGDIVVANGSGGPHQRGVEIAVVSAARLQELDADADFRATGAEAAADRSEAIELHGLGGFEHGPDRFAAHLAGLMQHPVHGGDG